jgi:hypothetical protein
MIVGAFRDRPAQEDQSIAADAEMTVAKLSHQLQVIRREQSLAVVDQDEIVSGSLPFGERDDRHIGSKYRRGTLLASHAPRRKSDEMRSTVVNSGALNKTFTPALF